VRYAASHLMYWVAPHAILPGESVYIHEYQAKEILQKEGISVLKGHLASSADEACAVASQLGDPPWVVKAQIHAGGRGKAGGIVLAKSFEEVGTFAQKIIGQKMATIQTGPEGKTVPAVYVEEAVPIEREFYLALLLNRQTSELSFIASAEGGMEIEKLAHTVPEKIVRVQVPATGYTPFIGRKLSFALGFKGEVFQQAMQLLESLYRTYIKYDCSLLEVNPLALTKGGKLYPLDVKMNIDDNALFRHPEIQELFDPTQVSKEEVEANKGGLSYVSMDGNIGCLVNGAGLAMATMDIIKLHGGEPANFLDVGGGANAQMVEKAFTLILTDSKVKAILVNIFGGITKCDAIAEGIVTAAKNIGIRVPLVVRLEGTNAPLGKKILQESKLKIIPAGDLADAAQKAVTQAESKS
jgi:succinyl-CoA synthetase beta subunit